MTRYVTLAKLFNPEVLLHFSIFLHCFTLSPYLLSWVKLLMRLSPAFYECQSHRMANLIYLLLKKCLFVLSKYFMKELHKGVLAWICFFGSAVSFSHIVIKMYLYNENSITTIKYVKCPKFLLMKKKKHGTCTLNETI